MHNSLFLFLLEFYFPKHIKYGTVTLFTIHDSGSVNPHPILRFLSNGCYEVLFSKPSYSFDNRLPSARLLSLPDVRSVRYKRQYLQGAESYLVSVVGGMQLTPAVGEKEEGEEPRHAAARHGHTRVSSGYQASFPIPSWCCQSLIFHHISKSCETI